MNKREMIYIATLPEGYDYRFMEVDGVISILGAHPKKKPIVVDSNGTITEIEIEEKVNGSI